MGRIEEGRKKEYEGEGIVVRYEPRRCTHAAECVRRLRSVFDPRRRPWIETSAASADQIADVVEHCPTGALTYERTDHGSVERHPPMNRIRIRPHGPLFIHGNLLIRTRAESEEEEAEGANLRGLRLQRAALCRCGHSGNKPFCDDSHRKAGFFDPGTFHRDDAVRPGEAVGADATDYALEEGGDSEAPILVLTLKPNGPVRFEGPLEIVSADGSTSTLRQKGSLCRCGHSKRKPFCDGSHREAGFQAD